MKQLLSEHRWASTKFKTLLSCKSESIAACVGCVHSFDLPREWQNRSYMQVCEQNAAGIGLIFLPASPCGRCGPCDRRETRSQVRTRSCRRRAITSSGERYDDDDDDDDDDDGREK